jgi:hypothetical protein
LGLIKILRENFKIFYDLILKIFEIRFEEDYLKYFFLIRLLRIKNPKFKIKINKNGQFSLGHFV